jgi:hypothetical protein
LEATITQLAGGEVETEFTVGQYNLLTGELEPLPRVPAPTPEEACSLIRILVWSCRTIRQGKRSWWSRGLRCFFL